jgi:hypothetical protein
MYNFSPWRARVCRACWLICLLCLGGGRVCAQAAPAPTPAGDGSIVLPAAEVVIHGPNARLEGGAEKDVIWWTHEDTSLEWKADIQHPGKYRVEFNYAVIGTNNGKSVAISVGDQTLKAVPKTGNGLGDYKTGLAGEVTVTKAGSYPIAVLPVGKSNEFVLNLRSISLVPASLPRPADDISGAPVAQAADGSIKLLAPDAEIIGMNAQLEGNEDKNIGFWKDRDTSLHWSVRFAKPGKYRIELNYALTPSANGSKLAIAIGDQLLKVKPKPGKNWADYKVGDAGEVDIKEPGDLPVVLTPLSIANAFVINLRDVVLLPADTPTHAINIADVRVKQAGDGAVRLAASEAEIDGSSCRLEGGDKKFIVWWNSPFTSIQWPVALQKPGSYSIQLTYSLGNTDTDSEVDFSLGDQTVHGTLAPGSGLDDFKTVSLGRMTLGKGDLQAILRSTKEPGGLVMHFESISLHPDERQ